VPFEFTAGSKDGGSTVRVEGNQQAAADFAGASDVLAMSFSDDGTVSGDVVFAGYGLVVPENQNFGYDSYAGLDVTGKVVMVLRYFPENADQATRAILARYSDLLAGLLPDARLTIHPDSAHGFLFQHHNRFAADVIAFLAESD